jgi:hypothetical protein
LQAANNGVAARKTIAANSDVERLSAYKDVVISKVWPNRACALQDMEARIFNKVGVI